MNTRDMTRKKQRRRDSIRLSSSGEIGQSKPPKDVLGLGRHLVSELGVEEGVDTLQRWMAHHLAELIDKAENGSTAAERIKARKSAAETILKVWKHRALLPGKAYPLASYQDVLKVLDLLRPGDNPFRYFGRHAEKKRDQLAVTLFDRLSRLIIALLLMKVAPDGRSTDVRSTAIKALSKTERHVMRALQQWGELFVSTEKRSGRARNSKRDGGATSVNLNEEALRLISDITSTLGELQSDLHEVATSP